jgi:hypothetical protein
MNPLFVFAICALAELPSAPPLPAGFIRGIGYAHVHVPFYGYGSSRSAHELDRLKELGADWIALSPFAYMKKVDRPEIAFGDLDPTLTAEDLIRETKQAHERGIKVLLKPHIWSSEFWSNGKWHGDIAMKSKAETDRWFELYGEFIRGQAEIAAAAGVDALSIGLEYVKLTVPENSTRWRKLIREVRAKYKGPLTYGAHHDRELDQIEFWDELDAIGVHGYFPLSVDKKEKEIAAEDVAKAWSPHLLRLAALAEHWKKPIVLTELGYPSHTGALARPWHSDPSLPEDQRLQAVAFQGTLSALGASPFIRGVFFWKWFSGGNDNPAEDDPYEPTDKEAESVLRRWYRR